MEKLQALRKLRAMLVKKAEATKDAHFDAVISFYINKITEEIKLLEAK